MTSNTERITENGQSGSIATDEQAVDHAALMHAFLNGAGLPAGTFPQGLTPEAMEMIGKLVAISVQGTISLNALRSLVKREVKADMTVVVVRNNNPLKFFQDSLTVLTQMFRKKMPGFMTPTEAMEDAYEDLHAHQLGVIVGVRAAMGDLLRRLSPERLETRIRPRAFSDLLFPGQRKARLWDKYCEQFKKINVEAQDDFQIIFGPAFLQAYEKQVNSSKDKASHA